MRGAGRSLLDIYLDPASNEAQIEWSYYVHHDQPEPDHDDEELFV